MFTYGSGLLHQLIAGFSASLGVFACAGVFGWVTPILPHLLSPSSEVPMTSEQASWMITMPEFGNLISPLPAGYLADCYGRKIVILSCAPMFFIGWVIILFFETIVAMSIARLIQGLAVGIVYTIIPVYLGEIASPKFRGAITSLFYCLWWAGFLFEYAIGPVLTYYSFTWVTASINIVFFLSFIWQPESPYYYLMKNDQIRAQKSLLWFRSSREEAMRELESMRQNVEEDQKKNVSWNELVATPADRKVLLIIAIIISLRQYTGLIPLSIFSTQTLNAVGGHVFISPDNVTLVMGVLMFLGSICSSFTLDIFGRRLLLFVSCFISALSMFSAGTFYYLQAHQTFADISSWSWIPPVAIFLLSAISVVGTFPVSITYLSELFTSNTRGIASAFSSVYSTVLGIFALKFYLTILYTFGVYVNFYIFTAFGVLGTFVSICLMPETKGKSFAEIRHEIEKVNKNQNNTV